LITDEPTTHRPTGEENRQHRDQDHRQTRWLRHGSRIDTRGADCSWTKRVAPNNVIRRVDCAVAVGVGIDDIFPAGRIAKLAPPNRIVARVGVAVRVEIAGHHRKRHWSERVNCRFNSRVADKRIEDSTVTLSYSGRRAIDHFGGLQASSVAIAWYIR
jgi:hypothetical protein